MRLVGGPRTESYAIYGTAGALLFAGPLWLFLYDDHYPLRPEYFLLVLGAAILGALGLIVAHRIGGLVESVCFALLVYLFLDMQFALEARVRTPVLLVIVLASVLLLRGRRAAIAAIMLGAFYVSSLPRFGRAHLLPHFQRTDASSVTATADSSRPVLLHVILDEQWGVGGLRFAGDTATAAFLTDFYLSRGFELHPAAYSRWGRTVESITDMLSNGNASSLEPGRPTRRSRQRKVIPYFELLRSRGYAIRVFQSEFLDYCAAPAAPVASCETHSANSVANIGALDGSAKGRAMLVTRYFLNVNSQVYKRLHVDPIVWHRAGAGAALEELAHLREAIVTGPRSNVAYFAHVMLPHRPLEVDRDCRALPDPRMRLGDEPNLPLTDAEWTATKARAADQIRCAHLALGRVLDALDQRVGRGRSIVLVQGDHGGRIFQVYPTTMGVGVDDQQLNARFSTLLAVRRPGETARVDAEPVPAQDFIWRLARQDFRGNVEGGYEHFVRASGLNATPADSLRLLTRETMPWAR